MTSTQYTGSSQTALPILVINGVIEALTTDSEDYSLQFLNNLEVGVATVKVVAKTAARFVGELVQNWTITRAFITSANVTAPASAPYTGEEQTPDPKVVVNGKTLVKDQDYTLSWTNNILPGTARVKIDGIGNYIGHEEKTWRITAADLSSAQVTLPGDTTFTGESQEPIPTVTWRGTTLVQDTDYTISWNNNLNAGTASVTITGKGNYSGVLSKTWNIQRRNIADTAISTIASTTYSGAAQTPAPAIQLNARALVQGVDYSLRWQNNVNAGTAALIITGMGNFTGTVTKAWRINPLPLSSVAIDVPDVVFNNRYQTPAISMTAFGRSMLATVTASWSNNKNSGTASVTLTGYGNLTGTRTVNFRVIPMTPVVTSVKSGSKKKLTVKWKKVAGATKYQVQYSLNANFKGAKTKNVSSKSKTKVLSGLKRKKTYYVRVRCYKTVKGVKYYSNWSNTRSVKVK